MDLNKVIEAFNKYTNNYDKNIMEISLKYNHSFAVMNLMEELADRLNLDEEQTNLAKIIGLLHDIGRFEQWKKYNSFSDTNVDHADESCNYLFKDNHIRDFIESDKYDNIIEKAIRYHNKLSIPDNLTKDEELFAKMIRDMDKVDIYKQSAVHFEYIFDVEEVTPEVLQEFNKENTISKNLRKTKSDAIILMLTFLFDINFEESYDILVDTDNFDLFLSVVEVRPNSEKLWKKIREMCFDKINRGLKRKDEE